MGRGWGLGAERAAVWGGAAEQGDTSPEVSRHWHQASGLKGSGPRLPGTPAEKGRLAASRCHLVREQPGRPWQPRQEGQAAKETCELGGQGCWGWKKHSQAFSASEEKEPERLRGQALQQRVQAWPTPVQPRPPRAKLRTSGFSWLAGRKVPSSDRQK